MKFRDGCVLRSLALVGVLCFSIPSLSRAATFNLRAEASTVTMPDGRIVPVWGFALGAGPVTVPGPRLELGPGDTSLTINLTNNLPVPVSIVVPGLTKTLAPVFDGGSPPRVVSFDAVATTGGGTASYAFTGVRPGTFVYESGADPSLQVQMGLYGAVIARPAVANRAYDSAASAFSNEIVMVLSEIDPGFHDAVAEGCYTPMGPTAPTCEKLVTSTIDYFPKYYLINGAPYSDPYVPFPGGAAGTTLLLRLVNAGLQTHTMTLQGTRMDVIAQDGNFLGFARKDRVTESIAAGQTLDLLIRPQVAGKYAFFDRGLGVTNAGVFPGGLIAFIDVTAPVCVPGLLERRVASASDDAEQRGTTVFLNDGSDLELGADGTAQTVGMRFTGVNIPQGSTITSAYLQFQADEVQTATTNLTIQAQATNNALTFTTATNNISSRARTSSVAWNNVPGWSTIGLAGPAEKSPDIKSAIQEVVNRSGWVSGNALAIIITGSGRRTAESFEGTAAGAPLLHVEFGCVGNLPPNGVIDTPLGNVTITAGQSVNFTGTGNDPDGNTPLTFAWNMGGGAANQSVEDPGNVVFATPGTFTVTFTVTDSLNLPDPTPATRVISVVPVGGGSTVVEKRVATNSDDAEQRGSTVYLNEGFDLELVVDGTVQTVGMRFTGLSIPQGATITNAYIQFQADEIQTGTTNLTIQAQAIDNAPTFTLSSYNISSRARTASVAWPNVPGWTSVGQAGSNQRTSDIKALIQAVVSRPGWVSGNAIVIIFTGSGRRTAESYEGSNSGAPLLHVEY